MISDWKVMAGVFSAMAALAACEWGWRVHIRRKSETWSLSHGIVTETAVHKGHDDIVLTIRYSYAVDDEPYPVPAEFQKTFPFLRDEERAQRWADALDQKQIPVRFDPRNHWRSTLWESDLEPIVLAHCDRYN